MSSALPGLRRRSPVHGLDRRNLGPVEVLAQSVSSAAPAAGMATVPAIVATSAGTATVWSFVLATALAVLVGTCIGSFTRRMAAAGSLYSLTAKGLPPAAAFASGAALLAGYTVLVMAALTGAAIYLQSLLARFGGPASPVVGAVIVVVLAAVAAVPVLRGVRLSARIVLAVEAVSIALMLTIFGVLLGSAPLPVPDGAAETGLGGVAAGVLPALAAFIGFEAATTLGVEARRPFRSVPRAVAGHRRGRRGAGGRRRLHAGHALRRRPRPGSPSRSSRSPGPGGRPGWPLLLDIGIATSFVACTLATGNALVRVLFSMGRDGIAPRVLGATHRRYRTPHVAIAVALPVVAAVPAALFAAGVPGPEVLTVLLTVATAGYLVGYLLVCLAAPLFLRKIDELTVAPVVVTAITVPALAVACAAFVLSALGGPVPVTLAALFAGALCWYLYLRWRRPRELAGIGVYDETSAADVHPGRS